MQESTKAAVCGEHRPEAVAGARCPLETGLRQPEPKTCKLAGGTRNASKVRLKQHLQQLISARPIIAPKAAHSPPLRARGGEKLRWAEVARSREASRLLRNPCSARAPELRGPGQASPSQVDPRPWPHRIGSGSQGEQGSQEPCTFGLLFLSPVLLRNTGVRPSLRGGWILAQAGHLKFQGKSRRSWMTEDL